MARTTVKLNHREIQSYLDGGHGVRSMLESKAKSALAAAQSDPHDDSGAYEDSLQIDEVHTDRMVLRVGSDIDYAMVQEARYGVLARALDAAS